MKIKHSLLLAVLTLGSVSGMVNAKNLTIGMSIDDLRLERWQKDSSIFTQKAEALGAKVFSFPVTRSSKRAPIHKITSALCIVMFAS